MTLKGLTAGEASERLRARLVGDAAFLIEGVASPETATAHTVCFVESKSYLPDFNRSPSLCWVTTPDIYEGLEERTRQKRVFLLSEKPYHSFVKLVEHFFPAVKSTPRKHSLAAIDSTAVVDPSAQIQEFVSIGARAKVGAGVILHSGVWIGEDVTVGENTVIYAGAKIHSGCIVGKKNVIHAGAVIGSDGFGFLPDSQGLVKVPQVGRVVLHDEVEVGANSTIDRGTLGDTIIGRGTKIDNLVQIGHNCIVGTNCILCAFVGLSGNTTLGNNVLMAGQAGTKGHLSIGDNVQVGAQSGVSKDIPSNRQVKGYPAIPLKDFLKLQVLFTKLPEIYKRLTSVEKSLEKNP